MHDKAVDVENFLQLVARMRNAQRWYFRNRDQDQLRIGKELERRVDAAIAEFQRKPDLFDVGGES